MFCWGFVKSVCDRFNFLDPNKGYATVNFKVTWPSTALELQFTMVSRVDATNGRDWTASGHKELIIVTQMVHLFGST